LSALEVILRETMIISAKNGLGFILELIRRGLLKGKRVLLVGRNANSNLGIRDHGGIC